MNTRVETCIRTLRDRFIDQPHDPRILSYTGINNGFCRDFAQAVSECLDAPHTIHTVGFAQTDAYPSHAWIECFGKHYDAECPSGVDSPKELPVFNRASSLSESVKEQLEAISGGGSG